MESLSHEKIAKAVPLKMVVMMKQQVESSGYETDQGAGQRPNRGTGQISSRGAGQRP